MERRFLRTGQAVPRALVAAAVVLAVPLLAGCAAKQPPPKLTYAERPCYRTLAEVDCHDRPLGGEETRRVGYYDTPVAAEQPEQPWLLRLF